ncbi:MAG: hypothetical protein ACFCD0_20225 [Gemmataceae bacterium]
MEIPRGLCLHHCTSEPIRFFGRKSELALLNRSLTDDSVSVVAMIGPGGQGKTAIAQTWLEQFRSRTDEANAQKTDGVFLWSFYRGKDPDHCLRELFRYAERMDRLPDVSASYCVDHLLPRLRRERWAIVLDGTEVVQHEQGSWYGRFLHPELGRLLEELASEPMPGVVLVTTRFPLPTLTLRHHARVVSLESLDLESATGLMQSLGVTGQPEDFQKAAELCGYHAKAVELLATYLRRFHDGSVAQHTLLSKSSDAKDDSATEVERHVLRVLAGHQKALSVEARDILALATAFRSPPDEQQLLSYLKSDPVQHLLHKTWERTYPPFVTRESDWLATKIQELVDLRLLERVRSGEADRAARSSDTPLAQRMLIDAHPLVRRGFDSVLGSEGHHARTRAGFLSGRPDRRSPQSLEEAKSEVELFHAYCDAGMWSEADGVYVSLDNPKHRFLAPAFERDLLLRFFPDGDSTQPPLWPGFGRQRSLAICCELLGDFRQALQTYTPADAALRGDALLALGDLEPLLRVEQMAEPWQTLWHAYRCHALAIAGRADQAERVARIVVPVDLYEWVHVFECLLRINRLDALDLSSLLYRPLSSNEHVWSQLARQRMRLDYQRVMSQTETQETLAEYTTLLEEYDRGGLPYERALTRLSYGRWLQDRQDWERAKVVADAAIDVARRHDMRAVLVDALEQKARLGEEDSSQDLLAEVAAIREAIAYSGPSRP